MAYVPVPVETAALDILHRAGWKPVTRDEVTTWFTDRSRHPVACPCWRCRAAAKASVTRVYRCLRDWGQTTAPRTYRPVAPLATDVDRQLLHERVYVLRDTGLTMQEIADQLHCSPSTVHRHLHA